MITRLTESVQKSPVGPAHVQIQQDLIPATAPPVAMTFQVLDPRQGRPPQNREAPIDYWISVVSDVPSLPIGYR